MTLSPYAPKNPTGAGTSSDNPYVTSSIMECYAILNAMHIRVGQGMIKVRYERIGPVSSQRYSQPVDHYMLYEESPGSDQKQGKLMDFYMYGYGEKSMPRDMLPAGLGDMMMNESPEQKAKMDDLMRNIFRRMKGL